MTHLKIEDDDDEVFEVVVMVAKVGLLVGGTVIGKLGCLSVSQSVSVFMSLTR